MTCIKTGAVILFEDYGVTHVCDVHQVGDTVIVKGTWRGSDGFHDHYKVMKRPTTHTLRIGHGIMDEDRQFAAVKATNFKEYVK